MFSFIRANDGHASFILSLHPPPLVATEFSSFFSKVGQVFLYVTLLPGEMLHLYTRTHAKRFDTSACRESGVRKEASSGQRALTFFHPLTIIISILLKGMTFQSYPEDSTLPCHKKWPKR